MVTKLERENNTIFYLHNAWANSPDGTAGFTLEESEDAAYIGNCISMSSAEVLNPSSYNWIAVEFEAVEESDTAELTELGEDVPEDPEDEDDDYSYEDYMDGAVQSAADTATTAQESADIAQQKAEEATASAALAQQKAEEATAFAAEAKTAADTAREKAEAATTDAATAKQKAEEATSSAALAQQKAESATAAAETAHSAAQSATSDAYTAGKAAATAQAAAEAAQGDIDEQKKYFYHDKLGAHVLDAAGGKFRTDVKSTGLYIVDASTEKTAAFFGANNCGIGGGNMNNIQISESGVKINNGVYPLIDISTIKTGEDLLTESFSFPGEEVWEKIKTGAIWSKKYTLKGNVIGVQYVKLVSRTNEADIPLEGYSYSGGSYGFKVNENELTIFADGSYGETLSYYWADMAMLRIQYSSSEVSGTVEADNFNVRKEIMYKDPRGLTRGLTQITSGTGSATADTGRVSIQPNWWQCGNLVQLEFGVATTQAVNPGKNLATGTITGIPRPITTKGIRAVSYYGNNANVLFISQHGDFTVRNCGSDALAKGNDAIGIFTYITDGIFTGDSSTGGQPGGAA